MCIYLTDLLFETRFKGIYRLLRKDTLIFPVYVINDIYRPKIYEDPEKAFDHIFSRLSKLDWKLEVLNLTPSDFDDNTLYLYESLGNMAGLARSF